MISQEIVNGQPPKAEAVLELSTMAEWRKDHILLRLDLLLDAAGVPGDVVDVIPRLESYMAKGDVGMKYFLQKSIRDIKASTEELGELYSKMRGMK